MECGKWIFSGLDEEGEMGDQRCRLSYKDEGAEVVVKWTEADDRQWRFANMLTSFLCRLELARIEHTLAEVVYSIMQERVPDGTESQPGLAEARRNFTEAALALCEWWEAHDEELFGPGEA
jgi:hypothetical protein